MSIFYLFFPFRTKTLVLELLAAVCLIVGGHERVIAAFDEVCRELGEGRRFETLVFFFRSHERLPPDDYSIDFMVCSSRSKPIPLYSSFIVSVYNRYLLSEVVQFGLLLSNRIPDESLG